MSLAGTKSTSTTSGRVSYSETGEGNPVVILHSLLTDRHAFDRVTPRLSGRMIALDLPGFGETTSVSPDIDSYADLLAEAITTLAGGAAPVLVGNGLGSFVALGIATRHPDLVSRLVLVGCGPTFPPSARVAFSNMVALVDEGGMEAVIPVALRRIYTEQYLQTHPEEVEERTRVLQRTEPGAFVTACRALQTVDYTGSAATLTAPTLLVVGSDDLATPPEMAAKLDHMLPNSRMVLLPHVAHAPQLQDPDGFVETVEHFLEEQ